MQVREVDPYDVNVDEMNERKQNLNLGELEESVANQGIIQPPIVRKRNGDAEVPYSVVVGQRRTLAAQGAGLETMPVIVMDWDDGEALEASITENIETFRENVSKRDRAAAIERLKVLRDWNNTDVAENLSVSEMTVRRWLEATRSEWEGTVVDPQYEPDESDQMVETLDINQVSDHALKQIREVTGGGEVGEKLLQKVEQHDLNADDVAEMAKKIRRGRDIDQALAKTIEEKHASGGIKVQAKVTFSGGKASALTNYAKDRGMSENEVVREAIEDYLGREGYL